MGIYWGRRRICGDEEKEQEGIWGKEDEDDSYTQANMTNGVCIITQMQPSY